MATKMRTKFRTLVSKKKRRLKKDGYNLDMSYVTDQMIAMGYPSEKAIEGLYRNPMSDVRGFLDRNHKGKYCVYNLCVEKDRQYDPAKFEGRVAKFPFADHNCPPIEMITKFCEHADEWLKKDEGNVCVVHCKAGKGRTGVMICAWLLYTKQWDDPTKAMQYYGFSRTKDQKGVTIPSQRRYIRYFFEHINNPERPITMFKLLTKIRMHGIPNIDKKGSCAPYFVVSINGVKCFVSKNKIPVVKPTDEVIDFDFPPVAIYGEVKVEFVSAKPKKKKMFQFWFNPAFHDSNTILLEKEEIDKAFKDKKCIKYPSWFKVEIELSDGDEETQAAAEAMMAAAHNIEQDEADLAPFMANACTKTEADVRAAAQSKARRRDDSDSDEDDDDEYETESETRSEAGKIEEYESSDEDEGSLPSSPRTPKPLSRRDSASSTGSKRRGSKSDLGKNKVGAVETPLKKQDSKLKVVTDAKGAKKEKKGEKTPVKTAEKSPGTPKKTVAKMESGKEPVKKVVTKKPSEKKPSEKKPSEKKPSEKRPSEKKTSAKKTEKAVKKEGPKKDKATKPKKRVESEEESEESEEEAPKPKKTPPPPESDDEETEDESEVTEDESDATSDGENV